MGTSQRRVQGEQAVTVHPHDAAERGITDGQDVRVFNDRVRPVTTGTALKTFQDLRHLL
jgi:anaerobic selenocysteine-containing dehydrogenase